MAREVISEEPEMESVIKDELFQEVESTSPGSCVPHRRASHGCVPHKSCISQACTWAQVWRPSPPPEIGGRMLSNKRWMVHMDPGPKYMVMCPDLAQLAAALPVVREPRGRVSAGGRGHGAGYDGWQGVEEV